MAFKGCWLPGNASAAQGHACGRAGDCSHLQAALLLCVTMAQASTWHLQLDTTRGVARILQQPYPPASVTPALPVPLAVLVVLDAPDARAVHVIAVVAGGAVAIVHALVSLACARRVAGDWLVVVCGSHGCGHGQDSS